MSGSKPEATDEKKGAVVTDEKRASLVSWVKKYRVQTVDDLVGDRNLILTVRAMIQKGSIPHVMLVGPPGVGKTSIAECLIRGIVPDAQDRFNAVLSLNASDDRGVNVVRNEILEFCKKTTRSVPQKIVFLDEMEKMTREARTVLRSVTEDQQATTRFIFACNATAPSDEPLHSRCVILRLARLTDDAIYLRLRHILTAEKLEDRTTELALKCIAKLAQGDMRQAIAWLETCATSTDGDITESLVESIVPLPPPTVIADMLRLAVEGDIAGSLEILEQKLAARGHSMTDIANVCHHSVLAEGQQLVPKHRAKTVDADTVFLLKTVATYAVHSAQLRTSKLQIAAMLAELVQHFSQ